MNLVLSHKIFYIAFFNIDIDRRRVYDLYAENVKEFIYKNLDEIENDLRKWKYAI